jgi:uncharacterized protein YndB with AHSA1/START domain
LATRAQDNGHQNAGHSHRLTYETGGFHEWPPARRESSDEADEPLIDKIDDLLHWAIMPECHTMWPVASDTNILYIDAPPERVWHGLTDTELSSQYGLGVRINLERRVGGRIRLIKPDGVVEVDGTVLEYEAERRLKFMWPGPTIAGSHGQPSRVITYQLREPLHDITRLTVTAENCPPKMFDWPVILSDLKTYLETGVSMRLSRD